MRNIFDTLVCPDCGCAEFTQRRVAEVEVTGTIIKGLGFDDTSEEVIDGGDRDGEWTCADCSATYVDESELVTEDAYLDA